MRHPLQTTWDHMAGRCRRPTHPDFHRYGGRGIECRFASRDEFAAFVEAELGPRPEGFTLDRVDNDGHYEPGSLRWADRKTQNNNRRKRVVGCVRPGRHKGLPWASYKAPNKKWQGNFGLAGKFYYVGLFETELEAHLAAKARREEMLGTLSR